MADEYYTLQQAADKLGQSEDQVRNLVKEGKLREYRDRGNMMYKQKEVDELAASLADGGDDDVISLEGSHVELDFEGSRAAQDAEKGLVDTEGIFLEPDESMSQQDAKKDEIGLTPGDESEIALAPDEEPAGDIANTDLGLGDLSTADTSIGTTGINVLGDTDDDYKLSDDALGETKSSIDDEEGQGLGDLDDDLNMDSVGSGSGLLDLSLQADDTSLGAVLDDILPGDDAGGGAAAADIGAEIEPDAGDLPETMPEPPSAAAAAEPVMPAMSASPAAMVVEPAPDSGSNTAGAIMFLPMITAFLLAIAVFAASTMDSYPSFVKMLNNTMGPLSVIWYIVIALLLVAVVMGFMSASGSSAGKPKAAKAKKPKKEKPKKEKKAKKK